MRQPAGEQEKVSVRRYLQQMAERPGAEGAKARAQLEGPEVPEPLEYLWQRFLTLDAMRGYGMSGPQPLTAEGIRAADQLFCWQLDPLEAEAVRLLDSVIRFPDAEGETTKPEPAEVPAWPTKEGRSDG